MCTLIALHACVPGIPLMVAANRDEYLDRPAETIALRELPVEEPASPISLERPSGISGNERRAGNERPGGLVVSPLDQRAGGTWLGLNAHGVFVALTNRPCAEPDPALRSRGAVVFDALREKSASAAAARIAELPASSFNPFNAFAGDGRTAWVVEYLAAPELSELKAGAHVIGNAAPDDRANPKVARILAAAEAAASLGGGDAIAALQCELASHEHDAASQRGALDDTCVHAGPYGTRSSLLLELADDFTGSRMRYADGPPCETQLEDVTPLLNALTSASSRVQGGAERGVSL